MQFDKKIYLDPNADSVRFVPADWEMRGQFLHHGPTHCLFTVGADEKELIRLFDFWARLDGVCGGRDIPAQSQLIELGRAAIAVYLIQAGFWQPEITEVERPKHRHRARPAKPSTSP